MDCDSDNKKINGNSLSNNRPLFEPSEDSSFSNNFTSVPKLSKKYDIKGVLKNILSQFSVIIIHTDADSSDEDPAEYLRDLRRRVQFSDRSQRVLDDSDHLLKSIRSRRVMPPPIGGSSSMSVIPNSLHREGDPNMQDQAERIFQRSRRSLSPDECGNSASTWVIFFF